MKVSAEWDKSSGWIGSWATNPSLWEPPHLERKGVQTNPSIQCFPMIYFHSACLVLWHLLQAASDSPFYMDWREKWEPNLDFLSWSHMPNLESFPCQQQHLNLIWALVLGYELYSAILWQRKKSILLGEDVTPLVMGPSFADLNTSGFFPHGSSVEEEWHRALCIWVAFNCDTLIHFLPPANEQAGFFDRQNIWEEKIVWSCK